MGDYDALASDFTGGTRGFIGAFQFINSKDVFQPNPDVKVNRVGVPGEDERERRACAPQCALRAAASSSSSAPVEASEKRLVGRSTGADGSASAKKRNRIFTRAALCSAALKSIYKSARSRDHCISLGRGPPAIPPRSSPGRYPNPPTPPRLAP